MADDREIVEVHFMVLGQHLDLIDIRARHVGIVIDRDEGKGRVVRTHGPTVIREPPSHIRRNPTLPTGQIGVPLPLCKGCRSVARSDSCHAWGGELTSRHRVLDEI